MVSFWALFFVIKKKKRKTVIKKKKKNTSQVKTKQENPTPHRFLRKKIEGLRDVKASPHECTCLHRAQIQIQRLIHDSVKIQWGPCRPWHLQGSRGQGCPSLSSQVGHPHQASIKIGPRFFFIACTFCFRFLNLTFYIQIIYYWLFWPSIFLFFWKNKAEIINDL